MNEWVKSELHPTPPLFLGMSTQLERKKEAVDTQWGDGTPSEEATQQALPSWP